MTTEGVGPREPVVEHWTRDGRTAVVEADSNGIVMVSIELMRQMMSDLGFTKADQ